MLKHVDFEVPAWGELASPPATHAGYAQRVLALGPVGYWRLGEASGVTAADEAGAHDGTYAGTPSLAQPGALFRDADTAVTVAGNGYVSLPYLLNPAATAFTALLWFKPAALDGGAVQVLAQQLDGTGVGRAWLYIDDPAGDTLATFLANTTTTGGPAVTVGAWHFAALTCDSGSVALYLDGQPIAAASLSVEACTGGLVLGVGKTLSSLHFNGSLDEPAVFDTALTADQIAELHRRGRGAFHLND